MRSQRDMRSMLLNAAVKSTKAIYTMSGCVIAFLDVFRRAKIWSMVERQCVKLACYILLRDFITEMDLRMMM